MTELVEVPPAERPAGAAVEAARRRTRIPVWAMPVLALLPVWAYVYQGTLEPPPAAADTPFALGAEQYRSRACANCHGADGAGTGSGPSLAGVVQTWPDPRDHLAWVRVGSTAWPGETYGARATPRRPGMPPHPSLSDAELAQVVLYERVAFGGIAEDDPTLEVLSRIAEGELTFAEAGLGPLARAAGLDVAELSTG